MCCHPPGGCWLSNTTKGWVSWKKWWLKVGRYAHLLNPFRKQLIKRFRSFQRHKICYSVTPITRKKSFQIILPSDVIIALRGTHGSRGIAETAFFVLISTRNDKMQLGHPKKRATLLSCQLPPLRAEGSKNQGFGVCQTFSMHCTLPCNHLAFCV